MEKQVQPIQEKQLVLVEQKLNEANMNITANRLLELKFEEKESNGCQYFERNNFILKPELGCWLFCANHNGYIVTTLLVIQTELELASLYHQSVKTNLYQ